MILILLVSNGLLLTIVGLFIKKWSLVLLGIILLLLAAVLKKLTKGFGSTDN